MPRLEQKQERWEKMWKISFCIFFKMQSLMLKKPAEALFILTKSTKLLEKAIVPPLPEMFQARGCNKRFLKLWKEPLPMFLRRVDASILNKNFYKWIPPIFFLFVEEPLSGLTVLWIEDWKLSKWVSELKLKSNPKKLFQNL